MSRYLMMLVTVLSDASHRIRHDIRDTPSRKACKDNNHNGTVPQNLHRHWARADTSPAGHKPQLAQGLYTLAQRQYKLAQE